MSSTSTTSPDAALLRDCELIAEVAGHASDDKLALVEKRLRFTRWLRQTRRITDWPGQPLAERLVRGIRFDH